MPKPSKVKYIVIHCSAGYGSVESIQNFWKNKLGWKSPGYHRIVDLDGNIHELADYEDYTNGVKSFNSESIHISYIGGVNKNDYTKAVDTRTHEQKMKIQHLISDVLLWLEDNGVDINSGISVVGHRDFSPDQNGDGKIADWERIKECPSFDAMHEYRDYTSADKRLQLPG